MSAAARVTITSHYRFYILYGPLEGVLVAWVPYHGALSRAAPRRRDAIQAESVPGSREKLLVSEPYQGEGLVRKVNQY